MINSASEICDICENITNGNWSDARKIFIGICPGYRGDVLEQLNIRLSKRDFFVFVKGIINDLS